MISNERRELIEHLASGEVFAVMPDDVFHNMSDDDRLQPFREFLASVANPLELHLLADRYNWDMGTGALLDIVRHPLCDLGTALMVY